MEAKKRLIRYFRLHHVLVEHLDCEFGLFVVLCEVDVLGRVSLSLRYLPIEKIRKILTLSLRQNFMVRRTTTCFIKILISFILLT